MGVAAQAEDPAKDYPSKLITLVVPYAAGGSSDTRARQIAEKISGYLGKPVIVDDKPGAAGNIGTEYMSRAKPDGYVIGLGNLAPLSVNKWLFPKMGYNPADLVPIVLLERGPLVLVVSADKSPYKSLNDLLADGKSHPGKLSYGSAGTGGAYHLAGEMLSSTTKIPMTHVPYKGGAPAMNDLLGGQVPFMFEMLPTTLPYMKSTPPRLKALAIATAQRVPELPDVPTFQELGLKDMEASNWFGIVAPKGTPPAIVAKLNQAINRALKEPDLIAKITAPGNLIGGGSPEDFKRFINSESERWGKLIKANGIKPD